MQQRVLFGSEAVPSLVETARIAAPTTGRPHIPYMERYHAEAPREIYQDMGETGDGEGGRE